MATYRHWSVSLWWDPDDVSHCQILSADKTEWLLISATLCGWRRCVVANQLWFVTHIREEEEDYQHTYVSYTNHSVGSTYVYSCLYNVLYSLYVPLTKIINTKFVQMEFCPIRALKKLCTIVFSVDVCNVLFDYSIVICGQLWLEACSVMLQVKWLWLFAVGCLLNSIPRCCMTCCPSFGWSRAGRHKLKTRCVFHCWLWHFSSIAVSNKYCGMPENWLKLDM